LKNHQISKVDLREKYIVTQAVVIQALGRTGNYFYRHPEEDMNKFLPKLRKN